MGIKVSGDSCSMQELSLHPKCRRCSQEEDAVRLLPPGGRRGSYWTQTVEKTYSSHEAQGLHTQDHQSSK